MQMVVFLCHYGERGDIAAPELGYLLHGRTRLLLPLATSSATAFVSGASASEISEPNLSNDQVVELLYKYRKAGL